MSYIENAGSLCRVYADNLAKLQESFKAKSLRGILYKTSYITFCISFKAEIYWLESWLSP